MMFVSVGTNDTEASEKVDFCYSMVAWWSSYSEAGISFADQ